MSTLKNESQSHALRVCVYIIELLHIECVLLYPVSQNGGFIRANLTSPRIFYYKNNVRKIQNGGVIRAKSGPMIRHQARILYLLILWFIFTYENIVIFYLSLHAVSLSYK